ncbi:MAG: hypothetical protein QXG15_05010 [Desulfurococcaceae archaeon]
MGLTVLTANVAGVGDPTNYSVTPMEELSILVDNVVVKQAVLAGFREGIIGYWPRDLDGEVEYITNSVYLPNLLLAFVIINGDELKYKYIVLLLGERFLLLALDKRVDAEKVGGRLLSVIRAFYGVSSG